MSIPEQQGSALYGRDFELPAVAESHEARLRDQLAALTANVMTYQEGRLGEWQMSLSLKFPALDANGNRASTESEIDRDRSIAAYLEGLSP